MLDLQSEIIILYVFRTIKTILKVPSVQQKRNQVDIIKVMQIRKNIA